MGCYHDPCLVGAGGSSGGFSNAVRSKTEGYVWDEDAVRHLRQLKEEEHKAVDGDE